jgi:protein-disulfide isomerase
MNRPRRLRSVLLLACMALVTGCNSSPAPESVPFEDPEALTLVPIWEFTENHGGEGALRVVEFSDFACPFCARFYTESYALLHEEFVATRQVSWTFVPISFVRGGNSELAAVASICADEGQEFPRMKSLLYDRQREWAATLDPHSVLIKLAEELGMSGSSFRDCLTQRSDLLARLRANTNRARDMGVRATPSFFIGNRMVTGAQSADVMRTLLEHALERHGTLPATDGAATGGEIGA